MKKIFTPTLKLSFGLMALTVSLMLIAQAFGLLPNDEKSALDARAQISEDLAVQIAVLLGRQDYDAIQATMNSLVERKKDVISAAVRNADGKLAVSAGGHDTHWIEPADHKSTPEYIQIPMMNGDTPAGRIEIVFPPNATAAQFLGLSSTAIGFIGFVAAGGFLGYYFLLKRVIRELNPSQTIPDRVKAAFDTLAHGVLIMDQREYIHLANDAFANKICPGSGPLIGQSASGLPWITTPDSGHEFPWKTALRSGAPVLDVDMSIQRPGGAIRNLLVNATRIEDNKGEIRGIIVTFNDVTVLQRTNEQLESSISQLNLSHAKISEQNKKLEILASNDPLTDCLNRRTFFAEAEKTLSFAHDERKPASFLMLDVDHFKSVNDRFGHAAGDTVLTGLAAVLKQCCPGHVRVGRYGGEEFCIAIAGMPEDRVEQLAEHIRVMVATSEKLRLPNREAITVSIGLVSAAYGPYDMAALVKQADAALYAAKKSGRNRVVNFMNIAAHPPAMETLPFDKRLKLALDQGTLRCVYLPKVDIRHWKVIGFEALVQWHDEFGTTLYLKDCIEPAIKFDLISKVMDAALESVSAAAPDLDAIFGPDTMMSIDLPAPLANDLPYMRALLERAAANGIGHRLIFELDGHSLATPGPFPGEIMPLFQDQGIRVSIDHFGGGHSSLGTLAGLPAQELKIDGSLIADIHQRPRSQSIVKAVNLLANALGMNIVACGIETYEDLFYIQAATAIRVAQGSYVMAPFRVEGAEAAHDAFIKNYKTDSVVPKNKTGLDSNDHPIAIWTASGQSVSYS